MPSGPAPLPESERPGWRVWQGTGFTVWYRPRRASTVPPTGPQLPVLLLGDDAEWQPNAPDRNLAGGVPLRHDPAVGLMADTSLVGLPPLFLYRSAQGVVLTSDLHLLAGLPNVRLTLDAKSLVDLGRIGHPVAHRTLFRDVEMVPAAGRVTIDVEGNATFHRTWDLPEHDPLEWDQFLEVQMAAFTDAVRRTELTSSFFSLTGGLDTRTVFAVLAADDRLVPAVTMTGPCPSLDARIAARLCSAYGVRHELITFDRRFTDGLPQFVETASRLSGGIASLGQAPDVYLYDQVGGGWIGRLSGTVGNQVGRCGTEGVSTRGANPEILPAEVRDTSSEGDGHWLLKELGHDERAAMRFILQREVAFASCGNYTVGNHFAIQQSPYADRALIETLHRRPWAGASAPSASQFHMRLRDLKHRFLGEPATVSFQRALVRRVGDFAARCPINWGWRAAGGISPTGTILGIATLLGIAARARGLDAGIRRGGFTLAGLSALHDFREARRWLRQDLRTFTLDTFTSRDIREAGLFALPVLDALLEEHFSRRRDHHETVTFALDIALAWRLFCRPA